MAIDVNTLHSLIPISQFSKGQATKIFDRLTEESQLVVLKNNVPTAILLSPNEYARLSEIEENYHLMMLAQERLANNNIKNAIPESEVMASLGITEKDIEEAEDLEIE